MVSRELGVRGGCSQDEVAGMHDGEGGREIREIMPYCLLSRRGAGSRGSRLRAGGCPNPWSSPRACWGRGAEAGMGPNGYLPCIVLVLFMFLSIGQSPVYLLFRIVYPI